MLWYPYPGLKELGWAQKRIHSSWSLRTRRGMTRREIPQSPLQPLFMRGLEHQEWHRV